MDMRENAHDENLRSWSCGFVLAYGLQRYGKLHADELDAQYLLISGYNQEPDWRLGLDDIEVRSGTSE